MLFLQIYSPPHSQPVVFGIPWIKAGTFTWETISVYKSAKFSDAFDDALTKYKLCMRAVYFHPTLTTSSSIKIIMRRI